MALSEHAASLLATFSLLTATISYLISPNRQKSFFQGVKSNIWFFSPFLSGAIATNVAILLIGYRILNLAKTHVGLALLVQNGFPPDLGYGFWSCFARRAFLVGATLPLYMMLLASANDRLIQGITTTLIAQTVLAELSTFHCVTSYEVRGGWPHRVLVEGSVFSADHVENEAKASRSEKRNEHRNITPTPALTDNLCDRIRQLSPLAAGSDITSASHFFLLEQTPELTKIFDPSVPAQWMCGHWRCLLYVILHIAVRAIWRSLSLIELVSTTWLLHCELEPVTLQLAGKLLEGNIINGVLSTLYDLCTALFIFIFAYIGSTLLVIHLFFHTPLITDLPNRIHILQRMQQKFQDLAEAAPIIHQVLKALLIHSIPVISSYYGSLALVTRAIALTQEKLSCIIEIIVIPTLYITVYCLAVGSNQALSEPNVAPDSNCQGTQDPDTTVSSSPHSGEKEEMPWAESKFYQTPKELCSAIFRLAIVVPTLTVWIFLYR
ncbi:uncharacterized protein Aud_001985 [Aspergillus udagawae]|uniref:Uncharacterized protein n=1 Tax=Aspergillus udagawae TaxID=91492 RepID=A0A8E0R441_9EURO|nr:uncharacterized protein Aud_001985 [Aspergillus udagawae]GIC94656.1 hypothetical protein Aud_001985 [Aspergillus udagawae]